MSLGGQAKLLRVLEEKIVVRVGGSTPIPTNTRVLAATNQNLAELVRQRKFREDLYFRLNVVTLELPPLRDRGDDVMPAGRALSRSTLPPGPPQAAQVHRRRPQATARPRLARQRPRAAEPDGAAGLPVARGQDKIDAPDLAFILSPGDAGRRGHCRSTCRWPTRPQQFQTEYIKQHIERARGNMTAAAEQARPAPLEPVSQDAAARDGDG